jgi:hypothetical protein
MMESFADLEPSMSLASARRSASFSPTTVVYFLSLFAFVIRPPSSMTPKRGVRP